jgi:hypothetical protein
MSIVSVEVRDIVSLGFPIYLCVVGVILAGTIYARQKALPEKKLA